MENKIFLFGEGEDKRDFLFIDDFLKITENILFKDLVGIFNVATGKSHSFREIADTLCSLTNHRPEIVSLPRKLKLANLGFNIEKLSSEFPNLSFTSLEQGLRKTLDSIEKWISILTDKIGRDPDRFNNRPGQGISIRSRVS